MHPIIESRRAEIAELCRRYHVRRLEVFGSAADGSFDPARSDVDFLVELEPLPPPAYADAWLGLYSALHRLFGRIDLVSARAVNNPHLKASIESKRQTLYAA